LVERPDAPWHRAKYVDMAAFLHLLGSGEVVTKMLLAAAILAALALLAPAWRRAGAGLENELWAATLCFTLVVSAYTPIYDTLLVIAAVALLAGRRRSEEHREAFVCWLLLLYMTPWFTQALAAFLHFQGMTLVLAGFGLWAWQLGRERQENPAKSGATHRNAWQEEGTIPRSVEPPVAGRLWIRSRG
jgi:hypothetical protein